MPVAQAVDLQPGLELGDEQDDDAVEHDHAEAEREHRERQRHADDQRPYERVDEADERGGDERHAEVLDVEAAEQHAEQQQGQRGGHPHDEDAQDGQRALHGSSTRSPGCSTRASTAGAIRATAVANARAGARGSLSRAVGQRQRERAPVDRDGDARGDPRRRLRRPLGVEVAGPERAAPAPHRQERDVDGAREVGHGHEEVGVAGEVDRARPAHHEAHRRDVDAERMPAALVRRERGLHPQRPGLQLLARAQLGHVGNAALAQPLPAPVRDDHARARALEPPQRGQVGVVGVQVRDEDDVGIGGARLGRRRRGHAPQRAGPSAQHGVGQHAGPVELDEDGRVPDPGDRHAVGHAPTLAARRM